MRKYLGDVCFRHGVEVYLDLQAAVDDICQMIEIARNNDEKIAEHTLLWHKPEVQQDFKQLQELLQEKKNLLEQAHGEKKQVAPHYNLNYYR